MSEVKYGTLLVEITGNSRSGKAAKTGNPYCMFEGFVHLPNVPYPQKADFYATAQNEVPQSGIYECDIIPEVRQGRLEFTCDPRQGRRKNLPPLSAAKAV